MSAGETVVVLPDSDDQTLCLQFSGLIRKDEHQRKLVERLQALIAEKGRFNLLVHYTKNFKGWEPDAADNSMKSISELGKYARKIAYVNPPEKKIFQTKLMSPALLGGEIRLFNDDEYADALAWVKN